jgi:hypothetical protein
MRRLPLEEITKPKYLISDWPKNIFSVSRTFLPPGFGQKPTANSRCSEKLALWIQMHRGTRDRFVVVNRPKFCLQLTETKTEQVLTRMEGAKIRTDPRGSETQFFPGLLLPLTFASNLIEDPVCCKTQRPSFTASKVSVINWIRPPWRVLMAFTAWKSMTKRTVPSGFLTNTIGDCQGLLLSRITPFFSMLFVFRDTASRRCHGMRLKGSA